MVTTTCSGRCHALLHGSWVTGVLCVVCTPTGYSPSGAAVWAGGPSVNAAGECQQELWLALSLLGRSQLRCRECGERSRSAAVAGAELEGAWLEGVEQEDAVPRVWTVS
ncbi:unnamed protein product [Closterium sp. NIES-54]